MAIDDSYYIDEWERRKMERVRSWRGGGGRRKDSSMEERKEE